VRRAFLHGFAGDPATWAGIAGSDDLCLALPGHGPIAVQPSWDSNLAAVRDAIGRCDVVVGYSLGARVALGLVAAGWVPRAILISVNPGISDVQARDRRERAAAWAAILRHRGIAAFVDEWAKQPLFATQAARVPAERLAARRARRLALDPEQLAQCLEAMGLAAMPDYRPNFPADRCRLICGADDAKFLAAAHDTKAPLDVIANCGHDPTLEQPERLTALLR